MSASVDDGAKEAAPAGQRGPEARNRRERRALEGGSPGGRGGVRGGSERPRSGHFRPMDRNARARLLFSAEAWDRATHRRGGHGGRLKRTGLAVLRALMRYHDHRTGRCDPSLDTIARAAGVARSTAVLALERLMVAGFIAWTRRAVVVPMRHRGGRRESAYAQVTNAYRLTPPGSLPKSQEMAPSSCESECRWETRFEKRKKLWEGGEAAASRPTIHRGGSAGETKNALETALARLGQAIAAREAG
ncbi:helix-turn-helix domain-containing protein [Roseomonas nepalensis]|uniref:Helix-turn-helix domain-containing protein n=1 Tax=Muricoccus nepalensis TaxID=1854500 RepID=A0A502EQY2_9PROT|nr:helix-turn-helix domain-containing protein [Roseomonas nepalensis]